ncbi:MAG: hypothetical protein K6E36_03135 [Oscillospiraceae bacterium]|nr:hypothetical protein [Oscillospiraceae bacterium]
MKRRIITVTILSTLLAASLTGCGSNVSGGTNPAAGEITVSTADTKISTETSLDSVSTSAAQTTTEAAARTASTTAAAETKASSAKTTASTTAATDVLSKAQMKDISKKLIQEYAALYDSMIAGIVQIDENDMYTPGPAYQYYRVTDARFQSTADLKEALAKTLSGSQYNTTVHNMFEGDHPVYLEQEGKLYALSVGRGNAYSDSWRWDELKFTKVTADSFTVSGKYVHIGDTIISESFDIVNTENGFRICAVSDPKIS